MDWRLSLPVRGSGSGISFHYRNKKSTARHCVGDEPDGYAETRAYVRCKDANYDAREILRLINDVSF